MITKTLNKYLINKYQVIEFESNGTIINSSNSELLNVSAGNNITDLHPFFSILDPLITDTVKEEFFEAIRFDDFNITADVIFYHETTQQTYFIVIVDKTTHYNTIQAITQVKNEAAIESQKAKLLYETLFNEGQLKNEFLASITHDLKTPIHSIVNLLDLINNLNYEQKELCNVIHDTSIHLNRLVNDVYDLAAIDTNAFNTKEQEFSMFNLLNNLEKIYLKKTATSDVSFTIERNKNVPDALLGDSNRVLQVLINLLDNAFKHTKTGVIKVNIQRVFKKSLSIGLNFIITDTGSGFDTNYETKTNATPEEGLGLGLSIANGIVEKLNGSIKLKSEVGKGTIADLYLPFKLKTKKLPTQQVKPFKLKKLKKKYAILVVEDNEINKLILMKLLISHGNFYIDFAPDSSQVLPMLSQNTYDFILLDLYMPGVNGFELIKQIKQYDDITVNAVNIIPMSASMTETNEATLKNQGITSSLKKPFTREALYSEIYNYL